VLFIVVLFTTSVLAADPQGAAPLKIGVIATLTKLGAYQGQQVLRGLELARDEINSSGGIAGRKIELTVEDSRAEPATAVAALRKLISHNGIRFVVGDTWNSTTVPLLPISNAESVLLLSPITGLDQLSADDLFFRTMPAVSLMMKALAEYAYCELQLRRIAVIYQDNSFGLEHLHRFTTFFTAFGGEIVGRELISVEATDVRTELLKLWREHPEGILDLHASGPPLGLVMKQAKQQGIKVQWLAHFGAENSDLVRDYGPIVEQLFYPYPYDHTAQDAGIQSFVSAYQAKYQEPPELGAANGYDALRVIAKAVAAVGEQPLAAKRFLLALPAFSGAGGIIKFDQNGDIERPILIKEIQNGRFMQAPRVKGNCSLG
jgi:branched-chain amino acid transport system substrate-binding protein